MIKDEWKLIPWDGNDSLNLCWRKKFGRGHVSVGHGDFHLIVFSYGANSDNSYSSTRWNYDLAPITEKQAMDAIDAGKGVKAIYPEGIEPTKEYTDAYMESKRKDRVVLSSDPFVNMCARRAASHLFGNDWETDESVIKTFKTDRTTVLTRLDGEKEELAVTQQGFYNHSICSYRNGMEDNPTPTMPAVSTFRGDNNGTELESERFLANGIPKDPPDGRPWKITYGNNGKFLKGTYCDENAAGLYGKVSLEDVRGRMINVALEGAGVKVLQGRQPESNGAATKAIKTK